MGYAVKIPNVDFSSVAVSSVTYVIPVPCTGISLDVSTLSFEKCEEQKTLTATPTPSDTTDHVVWTSSNENVATVDNGVVTIHGIGSATITANCGTQTATASITQTSIKAAGEFKLLQQYAVSYSESVLQVSANESQNGFASKYTGDASCAIRYAANKDFEATKVPYGATKAKFATQNGTNIRANYIYRADTNDLVTIGSGQFPKYLSNDTFIYADTGADVVPGQCIVFRIDYSSMIDTPIYIYFT